MIQLPINCILMGLITYFMFEAQINYMWSVKKSKWVKSYMLLIFILYVIPIFPKIVYTIICFHLSLHWRSNISVTPQGLNIQTLTLNISVVVKNILTKLGTPKQFPSSWPFEISNISSFGAINIEKIIPQKYPKLISK